MPNPIELQKALKGAEYPADRESLAELARSNGADDSLVEQLANAGKDRFDGPDDVQKTVFD
jgi:hypothetical protein